MMETLTPREPGGDLWQVEQRAALRSMPVVLAIRKIGAPELDVNGQDGESKFSVSSKPLESHLPFPPY
jgi:hypothetical protein